MELQPKVMDLLVYLVKERERVVTRDELLSAVWGGVLVGDAAISRAIKEVRRAVGDDGDAQRIVKTSHGRGFRFVASVVERAVAPAMEEAAAPALARIAELGAFGSPPEETADPGADDFVGRDDAVAVLQRLLRDVAKGAGRSLVIVGEAGIGKSALLCCSWTTFIWQTPGAWRFSHTWRRSCAAHHSGSWSRCVIRGTRSPQ